MPHLNTCLLFAGFQSWVEVLHYKYFCYDRHNKKVSFLAVQPAVRWTALILWIEGEGTEEEVILAFWAVECCAIVLRAFLENYWALLSITEHCWALLSIAEHCWVHCRPLSRSYIERNGKRHGMGDRKTDNQKLVPRGDVGFSRHLKIQFLKERIKKYLPGSVRTLGKRVKKDCFSLIVSNFHWKRHKKVGRKSRQVQL